MEINQAMRITKKFEFEAGHKLNKEGCDYGKCECPHGHSYKMKVSLFIDESMVVDSLSKDGMMINFVDLSAIIKPLFIENLDHKWLNDAMPELINKYPHIKERYFVNLPEVTTCEVMSYVMSVLLGYFMFCNGPVPNLTKVGIELWETSNSSCYCEFDMHNIDFSLFD